MFDEFENPSFWDERATEILNQNINYPFEINDYLIERKIFIVDELIKKFKPKTVLDAGCGVGGVSVPLAEKYPNIDFWLLDFSKNNISKVISRTLKIQNCFGILKDISEELYYKVDFLFSFDVLCHLKFENLERTIQNFKKSSKNRYYVFHALEYTILPYYYFMFSRFLPKKLATKLSIKYAEKIEKNKLPAMRGL